MNNLGVWSLKNPPYLKAEVIGVNKHGSYILKDFTVFGKEVFELNFTHELVVDAPLHILIQTIRLNRRVFYEMKLQPNFNSFNFKYVLLDKIDFCHKIRLLTDTAARSIHTWILNW